jgi:D-sedoheptulose 7-phosphate isomerase
VSGDLVARYHLLWELTHVVFEHPGLLAESGEADAPAAVDAEPTAFLYPFIEGDERDSSALLADLAASVRAKLAESEALRERTLVALAPALATTAAAVAERLRAGGRILTFGNGGSATDAQAAAALFRDPPWGRPLAARSLVDDPSVLTALANDIDFDLVFARQVIAHGRPDDIAVGYSTSGASANVLAGCEEAAKRGMLTVGTAGYDGGPLGESPAVRHPLVVRSPSVHRIQEVQATLTLDLWSRVQQALAGGPAP